MFDLKTLKSKTLNYDAFRKMSSDDFLVERKTYDAYIAEAMRELKVLEENELLNFECQSYEFFALNFDVIVEHLHSLELSKTTNSWLKLRRAFAFLFEANHQSKKAEQIKAVKAKSNWKDRPQKPGKNKRMITVTPEMFDEMYEDREAADDFESMALLTIGRYLGTRPCEASSIEIMDVDYVEGTIAVHVVGAKKTAKGKEGLKEQRGIDRTLRLSLDNETLMQLITALNTAATIDTDKKLKAVQARIRRAGERIFKNATRRFCLYSLRYTMGSNLKKTFRELDQTKNDFDVWVAAVMGHRNTGSQSPYGKVSKGVSTGVPIPSKEALEQVNRDRDQRGKNPNNGKKREKTEKVVEKTSDNNQTLDH